MKGLVLSLFPGIGMLDMAFEDAGFCVVRGPDLLWGGDVRGWKIAPNRFDGIIGGPPCKRFSPLANVVRAVHGEDSVAPDLIPEFVNLIELGMPAWFLMENVPLAPLPEPKRYKVRDQIIRDVWVGGATNRERRFSFGAIHGPTADRWQIETLALHAIETKPTVTTNSGGRRKVLKRGPDGRVRGHQGHADHHRLKWRPLAEMAADQGVPAEFIARLKEHGAFTEKALRIGVGNGVPLPMGRAVAAAVVRAIQPAAEAA